jgi:Zn-finger protein
MGNKKCNYCYGMLLTCAHCGKDALTKDGGDYCCAQCWLKRNKRIRDEVSAFLDKKDKHAGE